MIIMRPSRLLSDSDFIQIIFTPLPGQCFTLCVHVCVCVRASTAREEVRAAADAACAMLTCSKGSKAKTNRRSQTRRWPLTSQRGQIIIAQTDAHTHARQCASPGFTHVFNHWPQESEDLLSASSLLSDGQWLTVDPDSAHPAQCRGLQSETILCPTPTPTHPQSCGLICVAALIWEKKLDETLSWMVERGQEKNRGVLNGRDGVYICWIICVCVCMWVIFYM